MVIKGNKNGGLDSQFFDGGSEELYGKHKTPRASLLYGQQNGYMPRLGGKTGADTYAEWVSNTPHMANQIIAIPLYAPGVLDMVTSESPVKLQLKKIWGDVFSVHCKTIGGLTGKLTMEKAEVQLDRSGSIFIEDDTKVTRERPSISYGYDERLGRSIGKFMDFMIENTAGHAATQIPAIASNSSFRAKMKGRPWSLDMKAGTVLYVEMDVINVNVVTAWLGSNIRNTEGGPRDGKFDIAGGRELVSFDIPVTSLVEMGDHIDVYAQTIVDNMGIFSKHPESSAVIWPDVNASKEMLESVGGTGFNSDAGYK